MLVYFQISSKFKLLHVNTFFTLYKCPVQNQLYFYKIFTVIRYFQNKFKYNDKLTKL
jgi:hypothetical protein